MSIAGRLLGTAFVLGAGALTVAAIVAAPRMLRTARPMLREGLKRGMGVYEQARAAGAEFADDLEDLFAEVRSELASQRPADPPADKKRA
jgi:hypothetical protein